MTLMALTLFLLVVSSILLHGDCYCPSGCICDDASLGVHCDAWTLDMVPITLNPHITSLAISHSKIARLDDSFQFYEALVNLNMSNNIISKILDRSFVSQTHLEQLILSHNNLEEITQETLFGLESVKSISLNHNRLTKLPANFSLHCPNLQYLDISHNSITSISRASFLSSSQLMALNISHNMLSFISEQLLLPNLNKIILNNNPLSSLSLCMFSDMPKLSNIQIVRAELDSVLWGDCINHSPLLSVTSMDISDNTVSMSDLDLTNLPLLSHIRLCQRTLTKLTPNDLLMLPMTISHMQLSNCPNLLAIQSSTFDRFPHLTNITISNNPQLVSLGPSLIQSTQKKLSVDLSNNGLSWLDPKTLPWSQVLSLDLSNNPLHCDCSLSWLADILVNMPHHQAICQTPSHITGTNITQYTALQECNTIESWHISVIITTSIIIILAALFGILVLYQCRRPKASCDRVQDMAPASYMVRSFNEGTDGADPCNQLTTVYWDWSSTYQPPPEIPQSQESENKFKSECMMKSTPSKLKYGTLVSKDPYRPTRSYGPETLRYCTVKPASKPYYDPEYMLGPDYQYPLQQLPVYSTIINPQNSKTLHKQKVVSGNKFWKVLSTRKYKADHDQDSSSGTVYTLDSVATQDLDSGNIYSGNPSSNFSDPASSVQMLTYNQPDIVYFDLLKGCGKN